MSSENPIDYEHGMFVCSTMIVIHDNHADYEHDMFVSTMIVINDNMICLSSTMVSICTLFLSCRHINDNNIAMATNPMLNFWP